jgi:ABC-type antimicrobial peptide transport system permease subunit
MIAVRLEPGADRDAVMGAVHDLPGGGDAFNTAFRIVSADARRAVRFQVTALWLVTAIAAIATMFVVTQLVGRSVKTSDADGLSLTAIGWRSRDLSIERAIEGCALAAIAVPVASIVGFAVTAFFPLGLLRTFEPHAGRTMDWAMTLLGTVAIVGVVVAATAARRRRFGRVNGPRQIEPLAGLIAASGAGVALAAGAHLTTSRPTGGPRSLGSLLPGAIGLAGVVAAGIVGLSLTNIVDRPARWGVNYDQLVGNPFVSAEDDLVAPVVDDPDIAELSAANIGSMTINGLDIGTLAYETEKGDLVPTTLRGRPPANAGEIGLGAEVLRRLHVDIGDNVHAVGPTGIARDLRVVGTVVTPSNAGNGAAMTFEVYSTLSPTATRNVLLINLRDGASPDVSARLQATNFTPPDAVVTPTSVRALQRVTAAPFVLAILLSVFLLIACTYLLTTSVRSRGRDLAVLRALGSDSRQLRAIIHWHASLVAGLVVLVGFPAGVILGRWVVALLTTALGIVPGAEVPLIASATLLVFAVLMANVLALMPARRAARQSVRRLMLDR